MSKEQIDEAVRLYESGLSLIRVDKVVGADPKTVKGPFDGGRSTHARGTERSDAKTSQARSGLTPAEPAAAEIPGEGWNPARLTSGRIIGAKIALIPLENSLHFCL